MLQEKSTCHYKAETCKSSLLNIQHIRAPFLHQFVHPEHTFNRNPSSKIISNKDIAKNDDLASYSSFMANLGMH